MQVPLDVAKTAVKAIGLEWRPINEAPPSGQFLVRGPSGYASHKTFIALAHRALEWDDDAWRDSTGERLSANGWEPTEYLPLFTTLELHQ